MSKIRKTVLTLVILLMSIVMSLSGCINNVKEDANIGITNAGSSNQITYVDVTVSNGGIVSNTFSLHENQGTIRGDIYIGDRITLQARGGNFIGWCVADNGGNSNSNYRYCEDSRNVVSRDRTYVMTVYSNNQDIYALFKN